MSVGTWVEKAFEEIRSSLWFIPSIMTIAAFVLSILALRADLLYTFPDAAWYIFSGGPAGAGSVLSTIAGSMIGVTGVTFSITVVALSLASQQFGPRLLRNFMRDRSNQIVLGTFIATFVFCLLGLQAIDRTAEINKVPRLSVSIGFGLALASLAVLIYFIHHITRSIQAETVIANVTRELHEALDRLYPSTLAEPAPPEEAPEALPLFESEGLVIRSERSGYLQAVDEDSLLTLTTESDLVVEILHRPGEFVPHEVPVLRVWPRRHVDARLARQLKGILIFGTRRTLQQDASFAFEQLVEIAVRSLSPGVNDPYTAMAAIDRLGDGLSHLARRQMPPARRKDSRGKLRVVATHMTFQDFLDRVFDPIRRHGATDAAVAERLLVRAGDVASCMEGRDPRLRFVAQHAARVHAAATASPLDAAERASLDAAERRVLAMAAGRSS